MASKSCAWTSAAVAAALLATTATALAVPNQISYVGELRASNGVLYTGPVAATAALYGSAAGDDLLWGPQDLGMIGITQGYFHVQIGGDPASPLGPVLAAHDGVWIQLTLDGEAMQPRQRFWAAPFSMVSWDSERLGGVPAGDIATLGDLSTHPIAAFPGMAPPPMPVEGEFWYDTTSGKVQIWDGAAWQPVSAAGLEADELPSDGLDEVSNGTLSNEFTANWTWSGGPANIEDFPGDATVATITTSETGTTYLTSVSIQTDFTLTASSTLTLTLEPPDATGVGTIVLIDGSEELPSGNHAQVWTTTNTPALQALIGQEVEGTWTLTLLDTTEDLIGEASVGTLDGFGVSYGVVRSDHIAATGDLDVSGDLDVAGSATVDGDATVAGSGDVAGDLRVGGQFFRTVQRFPYKRGHDHSGSNFVEIGGSSFNFTKHRSDTALLIHWSDNIRCTHSGTGQCEWVIRIDDQDCTSPHRMNFGYYEGPGDNMHFPTSLVATCSQVAGSPIAAGTHEVSIWVRAVNGSSWTGHGMSGGGDELTAGLITIEEVY